jgi:hypothetical protein
MPGCFSGTSIRMFGSFAFGALSTRLISTPVGLLEDRDRLGADRAGRLLEAEEA